MWSIESDSDVDIADDDKGDDDWVDIDDVEYVPRHIISDFDELQTQGWINSSDVGHVGICHSSIPNDRRDDFDVVVVVVFIPDDLNKVRFEIVWYVGWTL